jgi:adenylate cyclase class IV
MTVQHKYFVASGVVRELAEKGIFLGATRYFEYVYFALPTAASQNEVLRIKGEGQNYTLDYKRRDATTGIWTKYETQISDPDQTKLLLKQLGISVRVVLSKKFRSWKNDLLMLDLVDVNDLFSVLEAKFSAEHHEQATDFMRALGFDPGQSDPRSSVDIFLEMQSKEEPT